MVGDPAPDFELENQEGEMVSLQDYAGRKTVVCVLSKDETPGCVKEEACTFHDRGDFVAVPGHWRKCRLG
ncbi:MAG: redoxin domain-containing protein [Bacteroidia bacterium]